jgi:hypothetical protein
LKEHDDSIRERFGDQVLNDEFACNVDDIDHFEYDLFDDDNDDVVLPVNPKLAAQEADVHPKPDVFDQCLTANILTENWGVVERGTVVQRARDQHGELIGIAHNNPLLDTREYEVEYPDGSLDVLTANQIAESLYSRIDAEGHNQLLMQEII